MLFQTQVNMIAVATVPTTLPSTNQAKGNPAGPSYCTHRRGTCHSPQIVPSSRLARKAMLPGLQTWQGVAAPTDLLAHRASDDELLKEYRQQQHP